MMIKLFGEPVAFEEEQPQQTRFAIRLIAAIFLCSVCCRHLDLPVIPMFAIYTFGPQIVGLLGLGLAKRGAGERGD